MTRKEWTAILAAPSGATCEACAYPYQPDADTDHVCPVCSWQAGHTLSDGTSDANGGMTAKEWLAEKMASNTLRCTLCGAEGEIHPELAECGGCLG